MTSISTSNDQTLSLDFLSSAALSQKLSREARKSGRLGRRVLRKVKNQCAGDLSEVELEAFVSMSDKWSKQHQKDPSSVPFRSKSLARCLPRLPEELLGMLAERYMPDVKRTNFYEGAALSNLQRLLAPLGAPLVKLRAPGMAFHATAERGVVRGKSSASASYGLDFGGIVPINDQDELVVLISHKFIGESGGAQKQQFKEMERAYESYARFLDHGEQQARIKQQNVVMFFVCDGAEGERQTQLALQKGGTKAAERRGVHWCASKAIPQLLASVIRQRGVSLSPVMESTLGLWEQGLSPLTREWAGVPNATQERATLHRIAAIVE